MSTNLPAHQPARRARLVAALAAGALLLGLMAAQRPALADPSSCPAALPVQEVTEGLVADGLTVERGRTPAPFTATVIGVLQDGIAPGLDMIIAETHSAAIDRAGGIWAGMSGSPVYGPDGRLIGAVSYGLANGASPIAGITPAADMYELLADGTANTQVKERVRLPKRLVDKVAASKDVTAAEASGGLRELPLPLNISGLGRARFDALAAKLVSARGLNARPLAAAGAPVSPGDPSAIVAGGNFASAISVGDISQVAVGTTTAVCDGKALAFGHPFLLDGGGLPAHDASALYVQPDPLGVPFKVANPGGVVGTVAKDQQPGLAATLGAGPTQLDVGSTVTANSTVTRAGLTRVAKPKYAPNTTALHLLVNFDRVLQQVGEGRSALTWTVDGTDAAGAPWRLQRTNRYADKADITLASLPELAGQLAAIDGNNFEDVKITGISVNAAVANEYRAYTLAGVEELVGGVWVRVGPRTLVKARSGQSFTIRATLNPYRNRGPVIKATLAVAVPAGLRGSTGNLVVAGGGDAGEDDGEAAPDCIVDPESCGDEPAATTFPGLLSQLAGAVHNNDVSANLVIDGPSSLVRRSARTSAPQVVSGALSLPVTVIS